MSFIQLSCRLIATALILTLVTPLQLLAADSPIAAASAQEQRRVQDVTLQPGGVLRTQVVDFEGNPVAGQSVAVHFQGREIARSISDDQGFATVTGLRPGQHTMATRLGATTCRFWKEETAPPSAIQVPTLVFDDEIARGQAGAFNLPMIVFGGATIASGVMAYNAGQDAEDAQDEAAKLQQRVLALETASP
jgi:hypothetical protein